ncbi:restriction endonuclease subunit S [Enterococcus hailinensis]|uniref:restriction endonuclease subunit S n=1 Tax=Enterococcus hailinensis TaxID=3238988 RepID=UPI0038B32891
MNEKKVPELRFKGFFEDWEQRKLGDLIEQVIREVPKPNDPYFRMSVRSHAKGTFKQFVDDPKKIAMDKLFLVRKNDLVVNITFAWEHAIAVVPDRDDGLLVSHRFPTYRADGKSDIEFLHYMVSKEEFRQQLELISPGGAGRNRVLNKNNFIKLKVTVPNLIKEQEKIGTFFKQLDDTIVLHQRKLELLKQLKQAYLQQMFPKKDEKIPELRFAGFEDDWEKRKLTDITTTYSGLTYSPSDIQDKGTFVLRSSNVKNDQVVNADNVYVNTDIVNSKTVKVGDVIVVVRNGSRSLIGKHAIIKEDMPNTVIGAFMSAFRGENGSYVNALLSTDKFQKEVHKSLGATINQITGKDFSMMTFSTPVLEEQLKIGTFFKQLDNTITLHQNKIEQLNSLKLALLKKMFI